MQAGTILEAEVDDGHDCFVYAHMGARQALSFRKPRKRYAQQKACFEALRLQTACCMGRLQALPNSTTC